MDWTLEPIFGSYWMVLGAAIGLVVILSLVRETGKVTRTQKMERRKFEYVAGALESGFYANLTCELPPESIVKLRGKLALSAPVYRYVLVSVSEEELRKKSERMAAEATA